MKLNVQNMYNDAETDELELKPNQITILVGKNGYGKSSLMAGIEEWCKNNNAICVKWSDTEYGRDRGRSTLGFNEDYGGLAGMLFVSEGQAMMTSINKFFIGNCIKAINNRKPGSTMIFLLLDQIDSGLDIHQVNYIKDVIRDTLIKDMHGRVKLDVYPILTANSFELVVDEDCVDPITRKHMVFRSLIDYRHYIDSLYDPEEEDKPR